MRLRRSFFYLVTLIASTSAVGNDWQMINDMSFGGRAAHDYLSAQQQVKMPTTVWPRPIHQQLQTATSPGLTNSPVSTTARVWWDARSSRAFFSGFEPRSTEGPSLRVQHQGTQQNYRLQLQLGYAIDERDQAEWIGDESLAEIGVWNWRVGVGAVSRWWGPGWDSSLILSNNARPAPSIYIERGAFSAVDSPWLAWLGPWHLVTFMSQLENDRDYANALLWGARFTFKPLDSLEIGLSRTALWGGDNRPQSLSVFKDLLLGNDNFTEGQEGKSTEPGNQLGGVDLKYSYINQSQVYSCYTQWIGEDEANSLPSSFLGLFGCSVQTPWRTQLASVFVETSNTAIGGWTGTENLGSAYEHTIYRDGYRYRDRPIGSQYDNDTKSVALGFIMQTGTTQSYRVTFRDLKLNDGNQTSPLPGGSQVARSPLNTQQLDIKWARNWQYYQLEIGYVYNTEISADSLIDAHSTWLSRLSRSLD